MEGYGENLSAKMENSRNTLRRIARHDDTEFSKESVLNAMDKFVKTVTAMEETVLVPRRLIDLGDGDDAPFSLYSLLNELKTDLLWACEGAPVPTRRAPRRAQSTQSSISRAQSTQSNVSRAQSIQSCDSDSEVASLAGSDSGLEGEDVDGVSEAQRAAADCRKHLRGLRRSLRRLTTAAADVTRRYQDDVGSPA